MLSGHCYQVDIAFDDDHTGSDMVQRKRKASAMAQGKESTWTSDSIARQKAFLGRYTGGARVSQSWLLKMLESSFGSSQL